jgi:xanthine/uracil/vitamin C permease (AzgA family)
MFDTLGTLYGASAEAGMLDENNDPIDLEKEMLCDSIGTAAGSLLGTSTITTFVESSAGVAAGGRTGLSSLVTSFILTWSEGKMLFQILSKSYKSIKKLQGSFSMFSYGERIVNSISYW